MFEELYVIVGSTRKKIDLFTPSGITLNFKSNIFGDLSKITCSYTYTFKLPLTANNRRVFDNADDIRATSGMIRRRLKAEYIQNGIPLFSNANLYIESTESAFNAVMTWGVIDGLQAIKDNDISIRELPCESMETTIGPFTLGADDTPPSRGDSGISDDGKTVHAFDNLAPVLGPDYNCGVPNRNWEAQKYTGRGRTSYSYSTSFYAPPLPVVPVYRIVDLINQAYGVSFKIGKHLTSENINDLDNKVEPVEVGVIPLVSTNLTQAQLDSKRIVFSGTPSFTYINKTLEATGLNSAKTTAYFPDKIVWGNKNACDTGYLQIGEYYGTGTDCVIAKKTNLTLEADGHFEAKFEGCSRGTTIDELPQLIIYQKRWIGTEGRGGANGTTRPRYEWVEVASLEGEQVGIDTDNFYIYDFNFCAAEFMQPLDLGEIPTINASGLILAFSKRLKTLKQYGPLTYNIVNSDKNVHRMDVMSNLPDISCMTFMKALFYMIGSFPNVNSDGEIVPFFYSDIRDNLISGVTIDWSKKVTDRLCNPTKSTYVCGSYGQRNLFMMKSDNEGDSKQDESNDVYESGVGILDVSNEVIEYSKTIIQLPFFAPYAYDKKYRQYDMGSTFKAWAFEKEDGKMKVKWVEPKPCLGLIRDRKYYLSTDGGAMEENGSVMSMIVWNGFTAMRENPSYAYLQRIMENPIIITETLRLNEHDLRSLDYSVPVYLDKYNAYFAIVSITRDSKGVCKCELIKLPEEE